MDRLRERGRETERSTQVNTQVLADSVMVNLRRMLNSRQGIASTVTDYGLPDPTDVVHNFPEAIDLCRRNIRLFIEKYEPRLRNVAVNHVLDEENPFHLRFEIRAQLVSEQAATPVAFFTTLDASGQAEVAR